MRWLKMSKFLPELGWQPFIYTPENPDPSVIDESLLHEIHKDIMELFFEQERKSEKELWERIQAEYFKGGLAAVGLDEVLDAAKEGRVEKIIVDRTFRPEGSRCYECNNLHSGKAEICSACGSKSLYKVGVVNEIIEMLELTGADVDFSDPIQGLTDAGQIAALLRY